MAGDGPSLLLSSLELSDTKVYEPYIRALLGTAAHFLFLNGLTPRQVNIGNGGVAFRRKSGEQRGNQWEGQDAHNYRFFEWSVTAKTKVPPETEAPTSVSVCEREREREGE